MRKTLLLLLLTFSLTTAFSQTFERPYFSYSSKSLPTKPFDRSIVNTYSPYAKLEPGMKMVYDEFEACKSLNMAGFKKLDPTAPGQALQADLLYSAFFGDARILKREVIQNKTEKKDKDGKFAGYDYSYHVEVIYGYKSEASLTDKEGQIIGQTACGTENAQWASSKYAKREQASNYYNDNIDDIKTKLRKDVFNNSVKSFNQWLSRNYTYPPLARSAKFLIVNSKKHPEYAGFQKIKEVLKNSCELVTSNSTLDNAKVEFAPAIKFFEDLLAKYSNADDKKLKKIRYAILYDLARIYEVLDDYQNVKKYGIMIIENDFTPVEGKEFCRDAERSLEKLQINNRSDFHPIFKFQ